jgi:hypothetical protein
MKSHGFVAAGGLVSGESLHLILHRRCDVAIQESAVCFLQISAIKMEYKHQTLAVQKGGYECQVYQPFLVPDQMFY